MVNPHVERYLAAIEARLLHLPATQRNEELHELRQHLDALIQGNRTRGMTDDDAVAAALRQFGQVESLGRQLQQSTQSQQRSRLWPLVAFYLSSAAIIFVLLWTANDKPTDFPATIVGQLAFALLLPLGTLTAGILYRLGTRKLKARR